MDALRQLAHRLLGALDSVGIPYMIVGSLAASAHGLSRATHDIDVVVAPSQDDVPKLAQALGDDFYLDQEAAIDAVGRSDPFNAVHAESGLNVGFWILRPDEFSRTQFDRRVAVSAWGIQAFVASPEDTILSKLLWNKMTPSDRQLADARGILRARRELLDYDYLRRWADDLGVADVLKELTEEE